MFLIEWLGRLLYGKESWEQSQKPKPKKRRK